MVASTVPAPSTGRGRRPSALAAPSRALVSIGTRLLTHRTSRRLRTPHAAVQAQGRIYTELLAKLAQTAFGREHGIHAGLTLDEFRTRVPLRSYEGFAPYIERMKSGENAVLWPGRCAYYAVSSGTTSGRTKYLPITDAMLAHFRQAGLDSLLFYSSRVGRSSVFAGKHLFLGGSTTLTPIDPTKPGGAYAGDLSGITAMNLPGWVEKHLYEPGAAIAQMSDWPAKIRAIAERTWDRDITLVGGIPSWLLILAEGLRAQAAAKGTPIAHLGQLWPNFECLVHGGVPITPFVAELRAALGPKVNFHEVYPASEGFIAAQDATPDAGLRLLADAGIYYEFLPLKRFDEARLANLGAHAVPLSEVQAGIDYALVMTTPAGLVRYVIGDVVRFVSIEPPRLVYSGRTRLQLSAFGEHVIEKELTDALALIAEKHRLTVGNFHVAPIFADTTAGLTRGRHEWFIELKGETPPRAFIDAMARELDTELKRLNDDYEAKRNGGGLDLPLLRLLPAGTFETWLRATGKWGGQSKTPRCRSDRDIADALLAVLTSAPTKHVNPDFPADF